MRTLRERDTSQACSPWPCAAAVAIVALTGACSDAARPTSHATTTYAGAGSVPGSSAAPPPHKGTAGGAVSWVDAGPSEPDPNFQDVDASTFLCNPAAAWSPGRPIAGLPAGLHAAAFSVTPDERSVAWIDDAGATHVADRAIASEPFGNGQTVAVTAQASPRSLSLSADGLHLVFVKPDAKGFAEVTRDARGGTFEAPAETAFALVNQWVVSLGATVADPAYGSDGSTFFYSQLGAPVTVSESRASHAGATPAWTAGSPRGGAPVSPVHIDAETFYRHPVSSSLDGLTLFISDDYPSTPTARAVYRTSLGGEFTLSVALGAWTSVHPNAACSRLYYLEGGSPRLADRQ